MVGTIRGFWLLFDAATEAEEGAADDHLAKVAQARHLELRAVAGAMFLVHRSVRSVFRQMPVEARRHAAGDLPRLEVILQEGAGREQAAR
ncbi:hypothetical protein [Accumulibacter sp.]|uniref:hypothetical protein n=1 Tax=Accumulibacter sp. TaxID=2053492 RepID=UPI0025FA1A17|nr:hypothetical protein [Accumulibacter sp.]MCP5227135.1 hypothetical protein [Accumulibacter sp.]